MLIEVRLQDIVEQLQQLVACGFACFRLGCPEQSVRHPLLDFVPNTIMACTPVAAKRSFSNILCCNEYIQALCNVVLLSGRMHVLKICDLRLEHWWIRSLMLVPIECPTGILGILLCADEQPNTFGQGEERLLSASLAQYARQLEAACHEQAHICERECCTHVVSNTDPGNTSHISIKNETISLVGHELRAPLSVIKGYAGLLQMYGYTGHEPSIDYERQRKYIDTIMEQTHFLEILVNDLLDISCLQHGTLALHYTAVDVEALCWQIIQFGQLHADQQKADAYQLVCKLDAALLPVWADADRLRQVLQNVMENAIKYSPHGGRIELEARCTGPRSDLGYPTQVALTIRDQGMGIPRQQMARVFQAFERLERPASLHIPGFGLGLYIARYLVEAMHGTLAIQSCEGRGTDVTIRLRTAETHVQVPSPLVRDALSEGFANKLNNSNEVGVDTCS